MPDITPDASLPEWNDVNLCRIVTELCTKAVHDKTLNDRMLADWGGVLREHIQVPDMYKNNFYSKPDSTPGMLLSVPAYKGDAPADATTDASSGRVTPSYAILCTDVPW